MPKTKPESTREPGPNEITQATYVHGEAARAAKQMQLQVQQQRQPQMK